jgi:tRNA pseudouridine55 synthase
MSRAQLGRPLDGVFLLDKPRGLTSNRVLQIIRRTFRAQKAGHTGSLDPLATGMLPICFGSATRLSQYLLDARKTYRVRCTVGVATDTGDADGREIATGPVPELALDGIRPHLQMFLGVADQVPPMYSALKHQGRRLYAIARQGQTVERAARRITVYSIDEVQLAWPDLEFTVVCSKGTYIRSLAEDIAEALGTVGHVSALRRLAVGPFASNEMVSLEQVQTLATADPAALDQWLLPMDRALPGWASVDVPAPDAARLRQGQTIGVEPAWPIGQVKLYAPGGIFFGLGEVLPTGTLAPRRIFAAAPLGEGAAVRVE